MATTPWFLAHNISVDYPGRKRMRLFRPVPPVRVVHGASVSLERGQILGLVGESGSGKSSLGRALVQLLRPSEGVVQLGPTTVSDFWGTKGARLLQRRLQMVFQDSWASLDPTQTLGAALAEPLSIHGLCAPQDIPAKVAALLAEVGLDASLGGRLPHALSGGQRQRANIARALAAEPDIIVADEPTSALDVSVKGHVLFMLQKLVATREVGLVFISHDLAAVRFIAQRVSVMYAGRIIETGPTEALFSGPKHPYTQALLAAAPVSNPELQRARLHRSATVAASAGPAAEGCPYRMICPRRVPHCDTTLPALTADDADHLVACHRAHGDDVSESAGSAAPPTPPPPLGG